MNQSTAKRVVLGSMLAIVVTAEVRSIADGKGPKLAPPIGGLLAGAILTAGAGPAPDAVAQLALIALVAQLTVAGPTLVSATSAAVSSSDTPRNYAPATGAGNTAVAGFLDATHSVFSGVGGTSWWSKGATLGGAGAANAALAGASDMFGDGGKYVTWKTPAGTTVKTSVGFASKLSPMMVAAMADGVRLTGGAWRSSDSQIALRKAHGCGGSRLNDRSCVGSPPTAVPGASRHERGDAIDFDNCARGSAAFRWLTANAGQFGIYNLPSESWHWSTDGH